MTEGTVVAVGQTNPEFGDLEGNITGTVEVIHAAARAGARLVVLPELSTTGGMFEDRRDAEHVAEEIPGGPACEAWMTVSRATGAFVVGGLVERAGDWLYNSAVLVGASGYIGHYRKTHLWTGEKSIYSPGDRGFPVHDLAGVGRVGIHICYDGWFPESYRLYAAQGADLVCVPANWFAVPNQRDDYPIMQHLLVMTGAHMNQMFVAVASRVGRERGVTYLGRSIVADWQGWPVVDPGSCESEEIVTASVDLIGSRASRRNDPVNPVLRDRRTDLYDPMLGHRTVPDGTAPPCDERCVP